MKIFCICYEDISGCVGSNKQVIEVVKNLQSFGHEITLFTPFKNTAKEVSSIKIKYIPVINLPVVRFINYLIFSPFYFMGYFLKTKPDIVLIFEIPFDMGPLFACRLYRLPFVFYVNGIVPEEFKLCGISSVIIFIFIVIQKIYIKLSAKIFVVTEGLKNYIHNQSKGLPDKVVIVKNGVDPRIFKSIETIEAKKLLCYREDALHIGFVGSLCDWHGIDYLIETAPLVLKEMPNSKFVIVGEKKRIKDEFLRKIEEKRVKQAFVFTGVVPFNDVWLHINSFDVCLVFFKPVRTDPGDPIKLYEYLSCAKPVVASNVKGYGDFVEEIGAGLSVEAGNPNEVAKAIVYLLRNPGLRKEMGQKGRLAVEKLHTWQARAKQIEDLFKEVISL